jgi:putative ABC transport system substrate-binding protein
VQPWRGRSSASLAQGQAGALLVASDIFFNSRLEQLAALAARYAIPTVYSLREFPMVGGLMSYGNSNTEIYRLAGLHVTRNESSIVSVRAVPSSRRGGPLMTSA